MATILLVLRLVTMWRDRRDLRAEIAQLRRIERPLCASIQRLQRAVDGSSDGYWEWNGADGTIWYSNRLRELFELGGMECLDPASSWLDALQPLDRASTMKEVSLQIDQGTAFDTVYEAWSKDGRRHWFRARGKAVRGANGSVQRMSGSIQ
jgi:PAS domain-containing protein